MLRRDWFLIGSALIPVLIGTVEYYSFTLVPSMLAFYAHNVFALLVGCGFVLVSMRLPVSYGGFYRLFVYIIGVAMVLMHIVKMVHGVCT